MHLRREQPGCLDGRPITIAVLDGDTDLEYGHIACVAGTVTHDGERARRLANRGGAATIPRSLEAFSQLASSGGWAVESAIERPFSRHVRLMKA